MGKQSFLDRLFSIRMRVHPTWYLATILITGILVTQFPGDYPLSEKIILGLVGSLLFLATITLVAFVSNLVALLIQVSVRNATLFVFGGVAIIPEDCTRPGQEVLLSGITLWLNLVAAGIFTGIYFSQANTIRSPIVLMLQWLAFFWYMLAIFHLIPAFPLAGGRILTALIWKARGNYRRALGFSTRLGWLFGIGLSIWGIVALFTSRGQTANALLLIFFGWALQGAASLSLRKANLLSTLQNIRTRNIMTREFAIVPPDLNIGEIVRDHVMVTGQDFFPIADEKKLLGIVTDDDIKEIPMKRWESTTVRMVMRPSRKVRTVSGDDSAAHAIEMMEQFGVERLPVIENGDIIGILTRPDLERLAEVRSRLKV